MGLTLHWRKFLCIVTVLNIFLQRRVYCQNSILWVRQETLLAEPGDTLGVATDMAFLVSAAICHTNSPNLPSSTSCNKRIPVTAANDTCLAAERSVKIHPSVNRLILINTDVDDDKGKRIRRKIGVLHLRVRLSRHTLRHQLI